MPLCIKILPTDIHIADLIEIVKARLEIFSRWPRKIVSTITGISSIIYSYKPGYEYPLGTTPLKETAEKDLWGFSLPITSSPQHKSPKQQVVQIQW